MGIFEDGGDSDLDSDLEGHLSDGAERGVESALCQVFLCHHV